MSLQSIREKDITMTTTSVNDQIKLGMLELNSQIMQGTTNTISNIGGLTKANALTKYNKEIDYNDDGTITFDEYVKFINSQTFSTTANDALKNLAKYVKTKDAETEAEKITIQNIGKAIRSYQTLSSLLPQGIINTKA